MNTSYWEFVYPPSIRRKLSFETISSPGLIYNNCNLVQLKQKLWSIRSILTNSELRTHQQIPNSKPTLPHSTTIQAGIPAHYTKRRNKIEHNHASRQLRKRKVPKEAAPLANNGHHKRAHVSSKDAQVAGKQAWLAAITATIAGPLRVLPSSVHKCVRRLRNRGVGLMRKKKKGRKPEVIFSGPPTYGSWLACRKSRIISGCAAGRRYASRDRANESETDRRRRQPGDNYPRQQEMMTRRRRRVECIKRPGSRRGGTV